MRKKNKHDENYSLNVYRIKKIFYGDNYLKKKEKL